MKYSIVFLEYDPEGINRKMTNESMLSVIEKSVNYDFELVHVKNVKGFVCAVNEGLRRSQGDHIVVVANDVLMKDSKWLDKFTMGNALIGWRLVPFFLTDEPFPDFACFGMSRQSFEKLGYMDERYKDGYGFDDNDYSYKAKEVGLDLVDAGVILQHLECKTYSTVFKDQKEDMTLRNQRIFIDKWHI